MAPHRTGRSGVTFCLILCVLVPVGVQAAEVSGSYSWEALSEGPASSAAHVSPRAEPCWEDDCFLVGLAILGEEVTTH